MTQGRSSPGGRLPEGCHRVFDQLRLMHKVIEFVIERAMLLIGFAGLGFAIENRARRSRSPLKRHHHSAWKDREAVLFQPLWLSGQWSRTRILHFPALGLGHAKDIALILV